MPTQFFPNPVFGWAFIVCVGAVLAAASWSDVRRMIVPKPVTLTGLALGLVFTVARCAWLGADDKPTWPGWFGTPGAAAGAADGVVFALTGFLAGFALFFAFWILGLAGGGDVKIVAVIGTWVGPKYLFGVVLLSYPVVIALLLLSLAGVTISMTTVKTPVAGPAPAKKKRLTLYSLPLAVATVALLTFSFRHDLGLVDPTP
ncbi:A24 family peptidase [Fimbriiglobus ruber]|uniref:Prepilin type IV endopeptidase peptidase domain-containing protein n=1 Tax=Fimbriiglobus ruber TaxID=1908690 RepID=A0A225E976_9BACT|nr:A24 family peptidase [Fimbriiglobus ruber]OWK44977.1 hypothetical protein FRUB_01308 [Fimbriiglobus ruber]